MNYFVDHKKKRIHQKLYAGDRCGFTETPVEKREFTDSIDYIERLVTHKLYVKCAHCRSIQTVIK
ncbi:hypothetical protein [Planomicrobium sp. CPCC 101079]|uniref:hypothetical protein n=1 Tax=Planomicrobium sp. CPCC 101079 TaxID=2599618 RepID=UPI0011B6ABCD|nr:hypothetical protein [Planomicrobium sp. CPCC 101079]TWT16023.1 hypothetical protein FQV28_00155 [Planomicrobium sp. CPCC 101079]